MTNAERLAEGDLKRLCEFLYRRTGILLDEAKRYFVERRLKERMAATGLASFPSYMAHLQADARDEIEQFVNAFTVNETYFYREEHQLRCLSNDLLAARLADLPPRRSLRIWSAPCSTGEEPYSIAIWLLENWPEVDSHDIEILGSDIDTRVLAAAEGGLYGDRALQRLEPQLVARYFRPVQEGNWQLIDEIRSSVGFSPVNLIDRTETGRHGRFDVVFCRNVLIYFDETSRRVAAENLFESLLPGGFLCLGHSESMSRISPLFEVRRFKDAIVYQRPKERDRG